MKASNSIRSFLLASSFLMISSFCSAQHSENGFNIQQKGNDHVVFIPEDSKIKIKMNNGNEVTGNLSGADSNSIFITRNTGKQKAIAIGSIVKMTVFHPHQYFTLLDGLTDAGIAGCGNGCSVVGSAFALIGIIAITAGELIVDGIADVANDEHYDLVNNWKIIGPVVGK